MGKKVYLDYKYKMDCEQQINYVSYLINNNTPRVITKESITSNDDDEDVLYSYSDINGTTDNNDTVCKKLTIT